MTSVAAAVILPAGGAVSARPLSAYCASSRSARSSPLSGKFTADTPWGDAAGDMDISTAPWPTVPGPCFKIPADSRCPLEAPGEGVSAVSMRSERLAHPGVPPPSSPSSEAFPFVGGGVVRGTGSVDFGGLGGEVTGAASSPPITSSPPNSFSSSEYGTSTDSLSLSVLAPDVPPSLVSSGSVNASTSAKVTFRRLPGCLPDATFFLLLVCDLLLDCDRLTTRFSPDPPASASAWGSLAGDFFVAGDVDFPRLASKSRCASAGDTAAATGSSARSKSYGSGPGFLAVDASPTPPSVLPRPLNAPVDAHSGDPMIPP